MANAEFLAVFLHIERGQHSLGLEDWKLIDRDRGKESPSGVVVL